MAGTVYVLITDPNSRKSFDVYNVLRKRYPQYRPIVARTQKGNGTRLSLRFTYGRTATLLLRHSAEHFGADLATWLDEHPDDKLIYFPLEEQTTLWLYELLNRRTFPNLHHALPSEATFSLVRNKYEFTKYCSVHKLPAPQLFTQEDLPKLKQDFVPVVAKPRIGSGSLGLLMIEQPEQLEQLERINWEEYVVQEMLKNPKDVKGGFFLMNQGQFVGYYGHQRIRTYPPEGGVTVFSKLDHHEGLKSSGIQILKSLGWHGLAMIEFLPQRGTGSFKAIEINPRAWGSFLLSEAAEAGFLENYLRLALLEAPLKKETRSTAFIRWLLPYDMLLFLTGRVSPRAFFGHKRPIVYINFSYTGFLRLRGIAFFLSSVFNLNNLQKLWKKLTRK